MKYKACLILTILLTLAAVIALADGAPASQFGFHGWPYRQTCGSCSAGCSQCRSNQDCASCGYCQRALCTAQPATATTERPASTAKPAATPKPAQTSRPGTGASATEKPSASTADYTTISVTAQEQKVLNLLNQDRQRNGLSALTLDAELSRLARIKCEDMRDNNYFAHESPTYDNAASMLTRFGYAFNGVGENIAHHATVEKAEAAFMSSSGHRGNILGSQWTKVGICVCLDSQGFVYVTQLFVR